MKVIFLDVDGVLNSEDLFHRRPPEARQLTGLPYYEAMIDPVAVQRLQRIVDATGADIVVSSTWRIDPAGFQALCFLLRRMGCTATVQGKTPRDREALKTLREHDGRDYPADETVPRGWEIEAWLLGHPEVEAFVILDDDSDMDRLQDKLVHTSWKKGLLDEHVSYAVNILLHGRPEDPAIELVTEKDFEWHTAGAVWIIPEVRFTRLRDGGLGLSMLECDRVHRIIAQRLLKRRPKGQFTDEELEFLMDVEHLKQG